MPVPTTPFCYPSQVSLDDAHDGHHHAHGFACSCDQPDCHHPHSHPHHEPRLAGSAAEAAAAVSAAMHHKAAVAGPAAAPPAGPLSAGAAPTPRAALLAGALLLAWAAAALGERAAAAVAGEAGGATAADGLGRLFARWWAPMALQGALEAGRVRRPPRARCPGRLGWDSHHAGVHTGDRELDLRLLGTLGGAGSSQPLRVSACCVAFAAVPVGLACVGVGKALAGVGRRPAAWAAAAAAAAALLAALACLAALPLGFADAAFLASSYAPHK